MNNDEKLQALLDEREIIQALTRYTRGLDRHDDALIESAFWPDATDWHADAARTPAELATWGNDLHATHTRGHQHFLSNFTIELDGDQAHVETYVNFVLWRRNAPMVDISGGRYLDRMERRNGEWRIAERVVVVDWTSEAPEGTDPKGTLKHYVWGSWGAEDPSFARPLSGEVALAAKAAKAGKAPGAGEAPTA